MTADSPQRAPFVLKILAACIAVQTIMLTYSITKSAERRGSTIIISTERKDDSESRAACPITREQFFVNAASQVAPSTSNLPKTVQT